MRSPTRLVDVARISCCALAVCGLSRPFAAQSKPRSSHLASATILREVPLSQESGSGEARPSTLPNGRRITPSGSWIQTAPYPFAVAIRNDGAQLAIPSVGWPFALNIIEPASSRQRLFKLRSRQQLPPGSKNDPAVETMNGIAYSADGRELYVSTGDSGAVDVYATDTWKKLRRYALDGAAPGAHYAHSFSGALLADAATHRLYVIDQGNWRIAVFDLETGRQSASIPTGVNPFALAISPDSQRLYVTNSGLFEYQAIPGVDRKDLLATGLHFPPYGYPSKAAREGARVEGLPVPALGDENNPRGSSVWTYDIHEADAPKLVGKLRLGEHIAGEPTKVGHPVVGGAAPMGIVADESAVYVSMAHEDAVAVLSTDGTQVKARIALTPFTHASLGKRFVDAQGVPLRGAMPAGMAVRRGRLFVTEAGINALAVIDTKAERVTGHIPVGWFPSAVAVSPDGETVYVVNTKGRGTGPNGGSAFEAKGTGSYIGEREFGSVSVLQAASFRNLQGATAEVMEDNMADLRSGGTLPRIAHVFLIIRENRTFDEILGDLPGADGDPALARWGLHGWTKAAPQNRTIAVTPNAHALAERFATSDQFYVDSDVSADGHRWMVGAAETPWFHLAWTSNYGGRRSSDPESKSPGRRALAGGSDAPMPEDEPQFGTLWEHVSNAGLLIRNYGEGLEVEGAEELDGAAPEGQRLVLNAPVPLPIFTSSDRQYPTFNLGIPDQYRYQEFARDFTDILRESKVPSLVVIRLPNDHTASPRPADGYADAASYVADNDLALGKMVDLISHSSIWKDSAILVAEDDAQGGVDHVDAHRSVMLAISPWVRPGIIGHRHISMGSLQKTAYELLGLGPLNLEDALAGDMSELFSTTPDLRPYSAIPADKRIFDPAKARLARPKNAKQARELKDMDDPDELRTAQLASHR